MIRPPPGGDDWRGRVSIRPGVLAFTGSIGSASVHGHAAVQVIWCTQGRIELADDTGARVSGTAAVIPAGARHAVSTVDGATGVTVFIDPSSAWAPDCAAWRSDPASWVDGQRSELARTVSVRAFESDPSPAGSLGQRVDAWVRSRLPHGAPMTDLAASMAMSEAALRRLATKELGLSVQTYARWVRLTVALEHVAAGASITDAAAAAGFADGAHATRACREMFGLTPSEAIAHLTVEQT